MASTSLRNLIEILLMSVGAICIAYFVTPRVWSFISAAQLPEIWLRLRSLLRPPLVYLLFNAIIISIAAASRIRLHSGDIGRRSSGEDFEPYTTSAGEKDVVYPSPAPEDDVTEYFDSDDGGREIEVVMYDETTAFGCEEEDKCVVAEDGALVIKEVVANDDFAPDDVSVTNKVASPLERQPTPETVTSFFESQIEKANSPPSTTPHPAHVTGTKPFHEGNDYETLESTWKRITEGRRRLSTSDTWHDRSRPIALSEPSTPKTVKKSGTFKERRSKLSPMTPRIRREPSLSQDELNERVEAFIRKFNQDMRLQRQNSFKYMMINPAA